MNWEETIQFIRKDPAYANLVEKTYFDEDLVLNIERFRKSKELEETIQLFKKYAPHGKKILDIGCGNGISSIAFALLGYQVDAVEPDASTTVGAGAIRLMKAHYQLENIKVYESFAEDISFPSNAFDIVYIRQAMHHANDLTKFIGEAGRVLKPGGILCTIRDHVVFDKEDKEWFLENHPLHKFYGGENAFSPSEYKEAMIKANLKVDLELKYFDSIINYFPKTKQQIEFIQSRKNLVNKIPNLFHFLLPQRIKKYTTQLDEKKVPGRMYSYIATKNNA